MNAANAINDNGQPGTPIAGYRYDGTHRRIAKAVKDANNWDRTDYYYNESWQVLEERFGDNQQSKDAVPMAARRQYVWDGRYQAGLRVVR